MTGHSCRWIYSLFLAIDANFRLRLKTRGIKDPELGSGLAYFVDAAKFHEHLKDCVQEEEVSRTSHWHEIIADDLDRSRPVEPSSMR